eukprot:371892-Pyramimonas_sp.AAC.1
MNAVYSYPRGELNSPVAEQRNKGFLTDHSSLFTLHSRRLRASIFARVYSGSRVEFSRGGAA